MEEKKRGPKNKTGKVLQNDHKRQSKSINLQTETQTDDLALANTAFMLPKQEYQVTEEDVKEAIVYENGATSIDFMLPEEEREILEKNLNNYSNMEKMQKALNMAKKNKLLSEDVKSLQQIEKADELINNIFDVMNDPKNIDMINQYIQQKLEAGDVAKAYKEIGLMNKAMMDARESLINKIKVGHGGKKAKIALKFTNDSGEDVQIGAEVDV